MKAYAARWRRGKLLTMTYLALLALGAAAGCLAGMFGLGGGIIIVPALIFLVGLDVKVASATSLAALIPPVGLLGAMELYKVGLINVRYAALVALGLFVGAYFGARIMIGIPREHMARLYGGFLLIIAAKMLISGK